MCELRRTENNSIHGVESFSPQINHKLREGKSMRVVQTNVINNTAGSVSRLERGFVIRRTETQFMHVREPIMVQRLQTEDFNNLVVVHDQVEQYI